MNQPPPNSPVGTGTAPFDAYSAWLKIPAERRPPNHYDLLGLSDFEADASKIHEAALDRMAIVRRYQLGEHGEITQQLMGELSRAFDCLITPERKLAYDQLLHKQSTQGPVHVFASPCGEPSAAPKVVPQILTPLPYNPAAVASSHAAEAFPGSLHLQIPRYKRPPSSRWRGLCALPR